MRAISIHPLAGIACRRELHYLARKTLQNWPILGPILPDLNVIPVDQVRADMSALKTVIKIVRNGGATVVFPEGARTLDGNLQVAQPGPRIGTSPRRSPPWWPMRIFGAHKALPARAAKPRPFTPITLVVGEPMFFTKDDLVRRGARVTLPATQRARHGANRRHSIRAPVAR